MALDRLGYPYDVALRNHDGRELHVYVEASNTTQAIILACQQLHGWAELDTIIDARVSALKYGD